MYERRTLETALEALGELLADRGESYELVAIGGGALSLAGLIVRSTEDLDLVALIEEEDLVTAEPLPPALAAAISDVAKVRGLHPNWINGEPTGLLTHGLPDGFLERCSRRSFGALTIHFADRFDQIHLKLIASSHPHDKHHRDLEALNPTELELRAAVSWARTQVHGEGAELELRAILATFGVEIDDE
jgi:hypothetical protein